MLIFIYSQQEFYPEGIFSSYLMPGDLAEDFL